MITARLFTWLALAATIPVAAASVPVAHAQRPPLLSLAQADAAVSSASHGNAHALSVFRGTDGMIGVVYRGTGGSKGIVWLTPHGGAVVTDGHLVDRQGSDLTKAAMYEQGLLLTPAAVIRTAAETSHRAIVVGTGGPLITTLFDPNCVYCHRLYQAFEPEVSAGRVRVRYVVVGTLKDTSIPRAASILSAKDPAAAMRLNESTFNLAAEEGGYPIDSKVDGSITASVQSNNALFTAAGAVGTPATFYCSKATGKDLFYSGMPTHIKSFVANAADPAVCATASHKAGGR